MTRLAGNEDRQIQRTREMDGKQAWQDVTVWPIGPTRPLRSRGQKLEMPSKGSDAVRATSRNCGERVGKRQRSRHGYAQRHLGRVFW